MAWSWIASWASYPERTPTSKVGDKLLVFEDTNHDGKADLVWRHSQTGDVAVWLMDGVTIKQGPVVGAGVPLAWQIVKR